MRREPLPGDSSVSGSPLLLHRSRPLGRQRQRLRPSAVPGPARGAADARSGPLRTLGPGRPARQRRGRAPPRDSPIDLALSACPGIGSGADSGGGWAATPAHLHQWRAGSSRRRDGSRPLPSAPLRAGRRRGRRDQGQMEGERAGTRAGRCGVDAAGPVPA